VKSGAAGIKACSGGRSRKEGGPPVEKSVSERIG
jgi:hypothetical protein